MSKIAVSLCLFTLFSTGVLANIGEDAKAIIKRYGKPDRKEIIMGGQKMWFRTQDYEITVYLKVRNRKTISVREEFRKPASRFMKKDFAKKILQSYAEKAEWKVIGTTRHNPPKTKIDAKVTHFAGPNGTFAVYCLNNDGSDLAAEHRLSAYVVFLDATAYREFNEGLGRPLK